MALTIDVGKIKIKWLGTYNSGTAYEPDDAVSFYDGATTSAYICVANSTGNDPGNNNTPHASWNYLARGTESASGGSADGQIQYKTGTGFGGETGFSYDAATDTLTAPNASSRIQALTMLGKSIALFTEAHTIETETRASTDIEADLVARLKELTGT